jgi:hypothetical protein
LCLAYEKQWTKEGSIRPEAVVCDRQYDWDTFYSQFANPFEGFTRTESNPNGIHAFQFTRDNEGHVRVRVKDSAAVENEEWRGAEGHEEGWRVFHTTPVGLPNLIPPMEGTISEKRKRSILHASVRDALNTRGKEEAIDWIAEVMEKGELAVRDVQPRRPGDVGPTGVIGVGADIIRVQFLQGSHNPLTKCTQFSTGEDTEPLLHFDSIVPQRQLPAPAPKAAFALKGDPECQCL